MTSWCSFRFCDDKRGNAGICPIAKAASFSFRRHGSVQLPGGSNGKELPGPVQTEMDSHESNVRMKLHLGSLHLHSILLQFSLLFQIDINDPDLTMTLGSS